MPAASRSAALVPRASRLLQCIGTGTTASIRQTVNVSRCFATRSPASAAATDSPAGRFARSTWPRTPSPYDASTAMPSQSLHRPRHRHSDDGTGSPQDPQRTESIEMAVAHDAHAIGPPAAVTGRSAPQKAHRGGQTRSMSGASPGRFHQAIREVSQIDDAARAPYPPRPALGRPRTNVHRPQAGGPVKHPC